MFRIAAWLAPFGLALISTTALAQGSDDNKAAEHWAWEKIINDHEADFGTREYCKGERDVPRKAPDPGPCGFPKKAIAAGFLLRRYRTIRRPQCGIFAPALTSDESCRPNVRNVDSCATIDDMIESESALKRADMLPTRSSDRLGR